MNLALHCSSEGNKWRQEQFIQGQVSAGPQCPTWCNSSVYSGLQLKMQQYKLTPYLVRLHIKNTERILTKGSPLGFCPHSKRNPSVKQAYCHGLTLNMINRGCCQRGYRRTGEVICWVQAIQFNYNGQSHLISLTLVLIFQNDTVVKSHAVMTYAQ